MNPSPEARALLYGAASITRKVNPKRKDSVPMSKVKAATPLVVTTEHGAFFGYGDPAEAQHIRLANARMIVYWSADCRSVVGLAANGPTKGCRIGPAAPAMVVRNVTAIIECSDAAAKKFEEAPWSA